MMEKSKGKLFFYGAIFIILLFGLLQTFITTGKGSFIRLELLGFLFLLLLMVVGFVGYVQRWGERVFFLVFVFYLGNLLLVWYFRGVFYVVLALVAIVGLVLSFPRKFSPLEKETEEPHSEVFETVSSVAKEAEPKVKKAETQFTPGKFVASQRSNVYHEPKCDWAKKIEPERRVWFKSKEEAWEKGYKKHSCID